MESTQTIINIIQGTVIISVSLFTAWWTYKTFAHKEKTDEIKSILNSVNALYYETFVYRKIVMMSKDKDNDLTNFFKINKNENNLGYFETAEKAARLYDINAYLHHGEFAYLNLPEKEMFYKRVIRVFKLSGDVALVKASNGYKTKPFTLARYGIRKL